MIEEIVGSYQQSIAPCLRPVGDDIFARGHRHYWLSGGRGSGKSSFAALSMVVGIAHDAMRGRPTGGIVFRKVERTLLDSVYAQLAWAVGQLGMREQWHFGRSPLSLTYLPSGDRILFRGADDPARTKSIKLPKGYFRYIWFEELTEFAGMEEIRSLTQSLIRGGGPVACLYTYNPPPAAGHWVNAEALRKRPDRLRHHGTYRDLPEAFLGEGFLLEAEALRAGNEQAWRREYLGEITGAGGEVFENLRLREITGAELATTGRGYVGLDFGFAVDPAALVRCAYDPARRILRLLSEYVKVGAGYDELAEKAAACCEAGEAVVADSAEPRSISELAARGLRINGARKGPGSVAHGIRWLQDLSAIVIDPARCPEAAREFAAYAYEPDGRGGFLAAYPDRDNHTIDAVRYALEPVIGRRKARVPGRRLPV